MNETLKNILALWLLPFSAGLFFGILIMGLLMNWRWGCGLI